MCVCVCGFWFYFCFVFSCSFFFYRYDTVLMHRRIQGETLYMCDQFGVNGKMCQSYKDFLLHGKASKSTALTWPSGIKEAKDFDNFSSSRSQDDTD